MIKFILITYLMFSMFIMMVAIILPLAFENKDFRYWYLIVYPLSIWFIVSQKETFELMDKYFN